MSLHRPQAKKDQKDFDRRHHAANKRPVPPPPLPVQSTNKDAKSFIGALSRTRFCLHRTQFLLAPVDTMTVDLCSSCLPHVVHWEGGWLSLLPQSVI